MTGHQGAVPEPRADRLHPGRGAVTLRAALLGLAAGSRASLAFAAPAIAAGRWRAPAVLAVAGELVGDVTPGVPSRTEPALLVGRLGAGALAGVLVARAGRRPAVLPALVGAAAAGIGAIAGVAWRQGAEDVISPLGAALAEDVVALGLAAAACRR